MRQIKLFFAIFSLIFLPNPIESARILFFNPTISRSHLVTVRNLLSELAERGHEVTRVTAFPEKRATKNIRDIYLPLNDELAGKTLEY